VSSGAFYARFNEERLVKPLRRCHAAPNEGPVLAQLSLSAYVRNLAHRFRSFMAIDRKVSAHLRRT
jgi:hypothetical protein